MTVSPTARIFVNKFTTNETFYPRISPTSFYALSTRAPTDEQATEMVTAWLSNRSRFCVSSPSGDSAGNSEGCYYGLPSIQWSDPAVPMFLATGGCERHAQPITRTLA